MPIMTRREQDQSWKPQTRSSVQVAGTPALEPLPLSARAYITRKVELGAKSGIELKYCGMGCRDWTVTELHRVTTIIQQGQ